MKNILNILNQVESFTRTSVPSGIWKNTMWEKWPLTWLLLHISMNLHTCGKSEEDEGFFLYPTRKQTRQFADWSDPHIKTTRVIVLLGENKYIEDWRQEKMLQKNSSLGGRRKKYIYVEEKTIIKLYVWQVALHYLLYL